MVDKNGKASAAAAEADYYRETPLVAREPPRTHFRDLPITSSQEFEDVGAVRAALQSFEAGTFYQIAQLCDGFGSDDRVNGVLQTREDALVSLPVEVTPRNKKKLKERKLATEVSDNWADWFDDAEVKRLLRWGLLLRVGVAEIRWNTDDRGRWTPRLKTWDPRYLWWNWTTWSFWMNTADGSVEVRPGDGRWVLYCPDGYVRGWMNGLIRSLALLFLIRRWAFRDWARYSEIHGLPIKKLYTPGDATTTDKEDLAIALRDLGGEGLVRLAKDEQGRGFDLQLLEPVGNSHEAFQKLIEKCDECIAVDVLGQNLTTTAGKAGSYAAADVHDRIRMDRVESDSRSLGKTLQEQVIRPYVLWNYGETMPVPKCRWSTKAPEARSSIATALNTFGQAMTALKTAGVPVDIIELARQFNIPLTAETVEEPEQPEQPEQEPVEPTEPDEPEQQDQDEPDEAPAEEEQ